MGGEICSNDGKSLSFETTKNFLLNSLSASRKLAIKLSGKIEKHRREGVDFPPLERYPFPAEGSHCWNLHVDALSDACSRDGGKE